VADFDAVSLMLHRDGEGDWPFYLSLNADRADQADLGGSD